MPMEVDVFLVGFDGDAAYGYKMDPAKLHQMLVNSLSYYCPHVWDTQEELGVCFSVHFQIGYPQDTPQVRDDSMIAAVATAASAPYQQLSMQQLRD